MFFIWTFSWKNYTADVINEIDFLSIIYLWSRTSGHHSYLKLFSQARQIISGSCLCCLWSSQISDCTKLCIILYFFVSYIMFVSLCWWQWVIAELACYTFSMALVPLYDTLGLEAMVHILNHGQYDWQPYTLNSIKFFCDVWLIL